MQRWEYTTVLLLQEELDRLGVLGWEAVGVFCPSIMQPPASGGGTPGAYGGGFIGDNFIAVDHPKVLLKRPLE